MGRGLRPLERTLNVMSWVDPKLNINTQAMVAVVVDSSLCWCNKVLVFIPHIPVIDIYYHIPLNTLDFAMYYCIFQITTP